MLDAKTVGDAILRAVETVFAQRMQGIEARIAEGLKEIGAVEQRAMQTILSATGKWDGVERTLGDVARQLDLMGAQHAEQIAAIAGSVAAIPAGADGRDGVDGKDGADGRDGRDALELEILDGIDPQKSYPRGTVATFRGGLIKAERRTSPIGESVQAAGWRVILRGVASTEVHPSEDLRTLSIRVTHTDGEVVEQQLRSPSLIYREIYREGERYEGGDAVTFGGSVWVALRDTTSKPGEGAADWRLAVKKGRDGRDAK